MRTYLDYEPWTKDPALVPLPWRTPTLPARLKIGIMWNDGIVTPHPPVGRALREVASALKMCDDLFDVVDWIPLEHDRCWKVSMALYFEDGGHAIRRVLEQGGEPACHLTEWMLRDENVKYRTVEEVSSVGWLVSKSGLRADISCIAQSTTQRVSPTVQ